VQQRCNLEPPLRLHALLYEKLSYFLIRHVSDTIQGHPCRKERYLMSKTTEIVDRGRGPQLSTSRITVQDLVPYFTMAAPTKKSCAGFPRSRPPNSRLPGVITMNTKLSWTRKTNAFAPMLLSRCACSAFATPTNLATCGSPG
jgi:hypothetical protein